MGPFNTDHFWIKRIITQLQGPATELLNLKLLALDCIGSNFDIEQIPNTIPDSYITCLKIEADFTASKPDNYKEIIEQPDWSKSLININDKSIYYEDIRILGDFNIPPNKKLASYIFKLGFLERCYTLILEKNIEGIYIKHEY